MIQRRTKLVMSGLAAVGGAIAGSQLYLRYLAEREDYLGVTLYSEANYRGRSRILTRAGNPHAFCSLGEVGLPRVGSIRVERMIDAMRPALLNAALAWPWARGAILAAIARDFDEARDSAGHAGSLLASAVNPGLWRIEPALTSEKRSWVRLWADRPTHPVPSRDDDQLWHDVLTDTPDLGSWGTRTRYLQLGIRTAELS